MTGKFLGCIAEAAGQPDAGDDERAVLRQAEATYHEAYAVASETLGPGEADRAAGKAVMDEMAANALRVQQLRALSIRSRRDILSGIATLKRSRGYGEVQDLGAGGKPPKDGWVQGGEPPAAGPHRKGGIAARALELLVENKPGLAGAPFASIEGRYRAVRGQLDAMMADVVEKFETKTGFENPARATLENVVREAFGEKTGDASAEALAKAWTDTAEHTRQMFNAAGGGIAKRDGWGLPQHHDPLAVRKLGREAWVAFTQPLLAREKMTDRVTGLPFTEKRLRAVLSETYDSIASGGAAKRLPGEAMGGGMLANSRGEERFLTFRDADAWLKYQGALGRGDPFGIMMGHLDEMAKDIAQMQILGPNPAHQFDWLVRFAEREAALEQLAGHEGAVERARVYTRQARNMLDHFTGTANIPEREWLAQTGAAVRAALTPAALGSALLSDMPSAPVFGAYARAFSGLSGLGHMDALVAHMFDPQTRMNARRAGFVLEQATDGVIRGAQDGLRLQTVGSQIDAKGLNGFTRRLPAAVFRMSYLTGWTNARKRTFRLEFMGALADKAGQSLAQLAAGDGEDRAFGQLLTARGFTEDDWAKIGAAEKWEPKSGAKFLRPSEIIAHAGEDLGLRVAEMIELQTRQAVPETSLWTRAKLLGQDRPGTFQGEFRRSWAMFRSFTVTSTQLFAEDMFLRGQSGPWAGAKLAAAGAGMLGLLTLAGGVSIQLREMLKGNNPRPMNNPTFWTAALMQGGGIGILGDFLYSAQSRAGKSSAMTGWGPAAAFGSDLYDATGGNVSEIATDLQHGDSWAQAVRKAHPGRDGLNLLRKYSPVSSLWWARAAWDRAVIDQLQKMVDPDADRSFQQRARMLQHDYGQTQWWKQGQAVPDAAPQMGEALAPAR